MAYEPNNGCFPVGPSDGDDDPGLFLIESGGEQGEASSRIGIGDDGDRSSRPLRSHDGDIGSLGNENGGCTAGNRVSDERPAVGPAARKRREQKTGLDRAGVTGQPGDLDLMIVSATARRQFFLQQINSPQAASRVC